MLSSPFNVDEITAQHLAGGGVAGAGIRDAMPDQHRTFFEALPYAALAATDASGWPTATLLAGAPGFIATRDSRHLHIALPPDRADPALAALHPGMEIGLLGIDLATRRRNRANGILARYDDSGLDINVQQSFGNCPQYIHRRHVEPSEAAPMAPEFLSHLDDAARAMIAAADTFFVASRARAGIGAKGGADISHRGGPQGFVRLVGDRLDIPDYRGNRYFNTLGNLLGDPRAGLVFVDFARGDLLQVQGKATIRWSEDPAPIDGTEEGRWWSVTVTQAVRWQGALPWRAALDA